MQSITLSPLVFILVLSTTFLAALFIGILAGSNRGRKKEEERGDKERERLLAEKEKQAQMKFLDGCRQTALVASGQFAVILKNAGIKDAQQAVAIANAVTTAQTEIAKFVKEK